MGIKTALRKTAEKIFQSKWYPNKRILLESKPDMGCQTYPVFQYMLKEGLNEKYKLIWLVSNKDEYKDVHIKNVKFLNYEPQNFFERFYRRYLLFTSRAMMYSNRYIGKVFDKQLLVYLRHGTASIKSRIKHRRENDINESDISISISHFFDDIDVMELNIRRESLFESGCPRSDYLFESVDYCEKLFPENKYDKIIIWMPTFRKTDSSDRIDSTFEFPLGLPCLYSNEDCERLNEALANNNILLVLKPHPAQDLSVLKSMNLSNFVTVYDSDIKKAGIQLYQFLGSTDALITDYSSVYYDYLLTGKNIGITIDDIDEYVKDTGFVFDNVFDILVGEYIKNTDEFIEFVKHIANDEDSKKEQREKVCNLVHKYKDNQSTKRVYEHIVEELEKRYK